MANINENSPETVENEVVAESAVVEASAEVASDKPNKGKAKEGFGAKVKEWFRKQIVNLKRNPQRIPFIFIIIVSIIWLFWLFTFSRTASRFSEINFAGLAIFVNTLLSILIIFLFLYAFPKRKKVNIVMLVLVFVFMAAMIGMDVLYYTQVHKFIYIDKGVNDAGLATAPYALTSMTYAIAHIVLQGVSIVVLALFPIYKKLLLKINTAKVVEGNDINETIDMVD